MPKQIGRPSKYNPLFVQQVYAYLEGCGREQTKLPKRVDIALLLDVDEDTLNNWGKKHEDFLGALTRVDMMQKSQLMDDGFYGGKEVNPRMGQFLLSAVHNMVVTEKKVLAGDKDEPLKIEITEEKKKDSHD